MDENIRALMKKIEKQVRENPVEIKTVIPINPEIYDDFKKELKRRGLKNPTNEQIKEVRGFVWEKKQSKRRS